ncbi:MAG: HlyD family type I secretion periplasmic adaptor subunit [Alphaproteobacteria bacterium]|nr:HlyD family type I secretion periplasmic adaptor subunit [Alphaproteobacteria bacterium]
MKLLPSVRRAPVELDAGRAVRIFQSETAEILDGPEPVQMHLTLLVLAGLFVSLLLVALCLRVDRVVTSSFGQVVTVDPTVVLGALDQSVIKTIDVRDGQQVHKGELLATLDPTLTTADVGALKAQVANYSAQIARCQAELAQKPFDLAPQADPVANTYIAAQREYYLQRKGQYEAQLRSYNDQVEQQKATIAKYVNDQARYGDRAKISKEIEDMRATLAAAQVGSRLNLLTATDQKLEIQRALEFDKNAIAETQHQLDSTTATRDAYIQQWFGQTSQELVKAQADRDAAVEQLKKATRHQELVQLQAPEDAMVLKIAKLSAASVLNAGEALIYLAPLRSPLEAEVRIAARDIGFIRVGDQAMVKLDAYNYIEHGTVTGTVRSISEGAFTTDDNNTPVEPYYKVRIALDPIHLRNVPASFRLVPGITLTGDIHIGTRSLFTYVLGGFVKGIDEAMREP